MYIPKPVLEDCLTSEISASGGDVVYDYITGSQIRRVHYFGWNTGQYEFEVHQGCTDSTQLFMVGGGGSGGFIPSQSVAQNPPNYPAGGMLGGAGGGGAGGVLFINPDRELTGSLQIVPGKYPITIGAGGFQNGFIDSTNFNNQGTFSNGEDTTLRYPFRLANDADLPSGSATSSRYDYDSVLIKAGGGGFGSYSEWIINPFDDCGQVGPHYEIRTFNAGDGGSGGGGGHSADGSVCSPSNGDSGSVEYPFRNQGNDGGDNVPANLRAGGGGGAGGAGTSTRTGGVKIEEFIRVYEEDYSPGGNGQFTYENLGTFSPQGLFISGSQRNFVKGVGGNGLTANIPLSNYDLPSPPGYNQGGWIDDLGYTSGTPGEAIITYALTGSQLTSGKLHYIDGGVNGGTFSFIPCGEVRIETLTVPAGKQACICALDTPFDMYISGRSKTAELWWREVELPVSSSDQYKFSPEKQMASLPSGSGTVTFTTGSECKAYVPFEGWETCGPCKESAPAGIYIGFDISGSSGRTNPLPYYKYPDTTIHWTSSQDYITSSRYNNHDSESYFETRFGAFSNDFDDDIPYSNYLPSASFSTSYQDQNVDFTTGSSCYTYYDCDPIQPGIISASGGIEGTFVSGSGIGNEWIYKYHIFDNTASFATFSVISGFNDANVLIIGGGGAGGDAYVDARPIDPQDVWVYGGGGGAGQVIETTLQLCNEIGDYYIQAGRGGNKSPFYYAEETIFTASHYEIIADKGAQGASGGIQTAPNDVSGSMGGGAGVDKNSSLLPPYNVSWKVPDNPNAQTTGGNGWSGSLTQPTGSAGGGGGAGQNGESGSAGLTAKGGKGGDGIQSSILGTPIYFAGGGAGYGPGGPSDGGRGGGGDSSLNGDSRGTQYGAGGGASNLNSEGGSGVVIINYKWKPNTSPVDFITYRGLSQYYDMYSKDSYDGTGSLVYSLWNEGTASLGNEQGWEYNTTVLDGSGSLEVISSSLHPYISTETESTQSEISVITTWFSNNVTYDTASNSYPLISDETFGTSSFGMYAGDRATYDEAIVIRVGDTEIVTEPDTAGDFVPRQGFHISQFSYNQNTNELLWYVDGYSGSATVNETIDDKSLTFNFNSSSLNIPQYYPAWQPTNYSDYSVTYGNRTSANVYEVEVNDPIGDKPFTFVNPLNNESTTIVVKDGEGYNTGYVVASIGPVTGSTGLLVTYVGTGSYYPDAELYNGRDSNTTFNMPGYSPFASKKLVSLYYDTDLCAYTHSFERIVSTGATRTVSYTNASQNSLFIYEDRTPSFGGGRFMTNVTSSLSGWNDCLEDRPVSGNIAIGLGDDSTFNLTAIYTASLTWDEMRHNDDLLYPRY